MPGQQHGAVADFHLEALGLALHPSLQRGFDELSSSFVKK
jgi:hypothetical protein